MKITQLPEDFKTALPILEELENANFEAYFVGGSVRDHILGLPIHDVDIATSAYPEEIKQVFTHTIDTGIQHGTVTVLYNKIPYELTTFRTESGYQDFRRPDKVTFVRSLEDDLKRRDFTINALAVDRMGNVIDKFNGIQDLDNKMIKAVGVASERFHEDALRMMRAVRFQSQLNFEIEEETIKAIESNSELLEKIAVERIREEFIKMMLSNHWQKGFKDMIDMELSEYCPEFKGNSSKLRSLLNFDELLFEDEESIWMGLGYVLELNSSGLNKLLRSWKVSNKIREASVNSFKMLKLIEENQLDTYDFYKLDISNYERVKKFKNYLSIETNLDELSDEINKISIKNSNDINFTGQDIMTVLEIKPGPQIGNYMLNIEKAIISGTIGNNHDEIRDFLLSIR
ncbi:CCA tRNA nucleotidyltransferase [Companilactobacillus metriopterae]|uniref:CCA tRNA nucleotidyltransferase n=1 Tax=Companilactobacillus metriopterae TaxID=1909267 RepID=UPI00100AF7CA|nr:CCA tRNA nucleotidyltransferase [Companilactobacillus metriopterae]